MIIFRGLQRRKLHDFITLNFYRETLFPFVVYAGFASFFLVVFIQRLSVTIGRGFVLLDTIQVEQFVELIASAIILLVCLSRVYSTLTQSISNQISHYGAALSFIALILCVVRETPETLFFLLFAALHAALITNRKNAVFTALFGAAVFVVLVANENLVAWIASFVAFLLFKFFFTTGATYDTLYRRVSARLNETAGMVANLTHENEQLHGKFEMSVNNIISAERSRIAREIHDTVGHSLTTLLRRVEIFRELNKQNNNGDTPSSPDIEGQMVDFEDVIRTSIEEMRSEVSGLRTRDEPVNWIRSYKNLCDTFAECSQINVKFVIYDELPGLTSRTGRAVYRIIQEGLTNSLRHGHAGDVMVMIGLDADKRAMMIKISDDGLGSISIRPGSGLSGITERVQQLHGYVAWKTEYLSGFDLGVEIPLADNDEERY